MTAWIVFLVLIAGINFIIGTKTPGRRTITAIAVCVIMILFQGLRSVEVGTDLVQYKKIFEFYVDSSFRDSLVLGKSKFAMEYGYSVFCKILSAVTCGNWQAYLILLSVFVNTVFVRFVYKYSSAPLLSIIIYLGLGCYVFTFSGLRQTIAITLCLLSYDSILKKKYLKFIIWVALAACFHKTAVVFLAVGVVRNFRIKDSTIPFIVLIVILIQFLAMPIMLFITGNFLPGYADDINGDGTISELAILLVCAFMVLYFLCSGDKNEKNKFLLNIAMLAAVCQAFGNVSTTTVRVTYYFLPFLAILFGNLYKSTPYVRRKAVCVLFSVFVFGVLFIPSLLSHDLNVVPYTFFWQ